MTDALRETLGFLMHDVARLMRTRFEQRARAAELGLTRAQWQVLAHLARREGVNQITLAQILEIQPITLVGLLDRLEAAGLVRRSPDPNDRRARVLHLTDAARPLLERMQALGASVREEALTGISDDERRQLIETLLKLRSNLTVKTDDAALPPPEKASA